MWEGFAFIPTLKGGVFLLRPLPSQKIKMLSSILIWTSKVRRSTPQRGINCPIFSRPPSRTSPSTRGDLLHRGPRTTRSRRDRAPTSQVAPTR